MEYNKNDNLIKSNMLLLFVNAHRRNEEGKLRFENFYKHIRAALQETVYYGN